MTGARWMHFCHGSKAVRKMWDTSPPICIALPHLLHHFLSVRPLVPLARCLFINPQLNFILQIPRFIALRRCSCVMSPLPLSSKALQSTSERQRVHTGSAGTMLYNRHYRSLAHPMMNCRRLPKARRYQTTQDSTTTFY